MCFQSTQDTCNSTQPLFEFNLWCDCRKSSSVHIRTTDPWYTKWRIDLYRNRCTESATNVAVSPLPHIEPIQDGVSIYSSPKLLALPRRKRGWELTLAKERYHNLANILWRLVRPSPDLALSTPSNENETEGQYKARKEWCDVRIGG